MNNYIEDKKRIENIGKNIGIELIKLFKNKERIALFFMKKEHQDIKDYFNALCNLHITTWMGNHFMNHKDVFDTTKTTLKEIQNKFDMIVIIDGVRYANDYNVELKVEMKNIIRLTYFTKNIFTSKNIYIVQPDYEYGIFDCKIVDGKYIRTIKDEYKYLIE